MPFTRPLAKNKEVWPRARPTRRSQRHLRIAGKRGTDRKVDTVEARLFCFVGASWQKGLECRYGIDTDVASLVIDAGEAWHARSFVESLKLRCTHQLIKSLRFGGRFRCCAFFSKDVEAKSAVMEASLGRGRGKATELPLRQFDRHRCRKFWPSTSTRYPRCRSWRPARRQRSGIPVVKLRQHSLAQPSENIAKRDEINDLHSLKSPCRHLRIVALSSDRVVDVGEAAGVNHLM